MVRTRVGYAGGATKNPTYQRIGDHIESVQVEYDPDRIAYEELLEIFFRSHTATRPRTIRQYESAIFYHDAEQKRLAEEAVRRAEERLREKVTTRLIPYEEFTRAEDYHQKYYLRNQKSIERHFESIYPELVAFTDSTAAARVNGYLGGNGSPEQFEREADGLGLNRAQIEAIRKLIRK